MQKKSLRKQLQSVIGLAAALAVLPLNSAKAIVYWTADTSRGTAVFNGLNIDEPGGTVTVVSDPLGQYGNVYKFYLPDETNGFGKERTESSGTETNGGQFLPAYNTEYYIGWRAMWNPMPINPGWVALMQMHGYGVTGQGAPLVLRCVNGDGNIYLQANANGVDTNFWHMPFHTNVWQGFVEHVFLSTNPAVGYVEFWVNGVQQTFNNGQTRWYTPTWDNVDGLYQDSYNKLKWGVYRSGAMDGKGPATAYMSGATVGSTYADVDPGIGGTPDFSLSASPNSLTITQGANGTSTITVNPVNGYSGTVSLSASGLPSGVTASFNPSSTTSSSTLTLTASGTATTGTATVTVTGTDGTLTHTTTISLTVNPPPDFSLSASPSSLTVVQGNNGTSTITVNPLNGYSGTVSLSASGLPSGVTASFNPSSTTSSSTLTLTASSTATLGTATVTITGTDGTLTHSITIALTVNPAPDFSLSASPSSLTIIQGNNGISTITVNPLNGFNGSVSLSASGLPSGVTASFNPSSTTSTSTLTLTASSTATTGTATITITGTSGSLTRTTTIALTVNAAPDFSLSASPSSLTVVQGNNGTSTITVSLLNGFSGSVSLSASGLPGGVTASFNPSSTTSTSTLTLTASSTATTGTATITVTGTSGSLTHTTTISLTVQAAGGGLPTGWTDADIGAVGLAGSASYSSGTFTVSGSGSDIWTAADQFNYAYQSVSGDQTVIARVVSENGTQSYAKAGVMIRETLATNAIEASVLLTPTNGVAMEVRPTTGAASINVVGWVRGISPPQWVKLVRSGSTFAASYSADGSTWTQFASTNVTMNSSATAGLAVTAHSTTNLNTANFDNVSITGPAPDFSLSASPNSLTVVQGNNGTSTITVNPINGYSGTVSLSASGLPSGVTASFNPSSTTSSSTLTLTASGTATTGTATVTITGTDGTLTHTTTISLTVNPAQTFAGIYKIQNEASGLVLNNQGALTNGAPITQWTATTVSSNLDWTFIATSNGYYQINSSKSGLDAAVSGASTANGAGIVQWSFGTSGDDQWEPVANSDGSYTFFNLHSGLVLEDPGSSTNKTTQMDQWSSTGASNQKWNLLKQ